MSKINLEDGKYTVINDNGRLQLRRYGSATGMMDSYAHSGFVLALVQRIEALEGYAKHKTDCTLVTGEDPEGAACTCGLWRLIWAG